MQNSRGALDLALTQGMRSNPVSLLSLARYGATHKLGGQKLRRLSLSCNDIKRLVTKMGRSESTWTSSSPAVQPGLVSGKLLVLLR